LIGSPHFGLLGTSAAGSPVYSNADGTYLYWDLSCDGVERSAADQRPRWILDDDEPSMTAAMDLDGDGSCAFFGYASSRSDELRGVPFGNTGWKIACGEDTISASVGIEYSAVLPTPSPTLEPGKACPCEDSCGYFPYIDIDGDGCLQEEEVDAVPQLTGHFLQIDIDGDGCVNRTECSMSSFSADLPTFPIAGPAECDYGYYFVEGTSVCGNCATGETRRRRSEACTECPEGKFDLGEFDSCIGGAYLTAPIEIGDVNVAVNTDTDESGIVMTIGDGITVSTRNPGHFERFIITGKVGFGDDPAARTPEQHARFQRKGSYFVFDHGTNNAFQKYDAMLSACTRINGIDLSGSYPCGCGSAQCVSGEMCDQDCGGSISVTESGSSYGNGGCCIGPPVSPLPTPAPTVQARGDPHLVNLAGEHFDINHGGEFDLLRIPQAAHEPPEVQMRATIRPEHGRPCTTYITEVEFYGVWLGNRTVQIRSYLRSHSKDGADKSLSVRVLNHNATSEVPWESITDWTHERYQLSEPGGTKRSRFEMTLSKTQWYSKKGRAGAPTAAGQFTIQIQNRRNRRFNESAEIRVRQDLPEQEHLNVVVRNLGALGRSDIGGLLGFDPHPVSLEEVTSECQRHRDGLDAKQGPQTKPYWKTRWERIKASRAMGGSMVDNEAAAALIGNGDQGRTRGLMCVCPPRDPAGPAGEELGERPAGGGVEGVVADFQVGRLAEATWD
jgi:hypothetical protein